MDEEVVAVDIAGTVRYGAKIQDLCLEVQQKVNNSIETMTGLVVSKVDVHVICVYFQQEKTVEEY